mmetsp:Transcript_26401/g.105695  ORF Transcript_26401/g.105695 Transcript_26401/m.105695 type:complete len:221 (-) Transcript_26401:289-951(-)
MARRRGSSLAAWRLVLLATLAGATTRVYPVEGLVALRDREATVPTTEVVLNGGEYRTLTRADGSFVFHDVKPGVYLLDVLSVDYFFSQVKINLPKSAEQAGIQCLEYAYPGAPKRSIAYPLRLVSPGKKQYFEQRERVGLHTVIRNPMLLMLGFTALMVVVMPKLMDNMDPEEKAKLQEQMGAAQDPASFLKHMFGLPADGEDGDAPQVTDGRRATDAAK